MAAQRPDDSRRPSEGGSEPRASRAQQSVRLSPSLRRRLRLWAAFLDTEISEIVEEAVAARLDAMDRERAHRNLPPLPNRTTEPASSWRGTREPKPHQERGA